jgi:hypothetical protein
MCDKLFDLGELALTGMHFCIRPSAPVWQMCIGAPLILVSGLATTGLVCAEGSFSSWESVVLTVFFGAIGISCIGYGLKAYWDICQKLTIDVSSGAYVTTCEEEKPDGCRCLPWSTGLGDLLLEDHVGQVQDCVGSSLFTVAFPPRMDKDGTVRGGTFPIKKQVLRQSTAEAFNAQPVAQQQQQQGYTPPTLEQPNTTSPGSQPQPDMLRGGTPLMSAPHQQASQPHVSVAQQSQSSLTVPTASVSRPASPPRTQEQQPQGISGEQSSLTAFLDSARLAKYEAAFRERGCESVQDLGGLEEQDMVEIGMKKVEITRLRRLGPQGLHGSE